MAKLFNLARMTTATTGTGTITLGSAVSGWLTFALAGVANGETVTYAIRDGANSEIGRGVYTASGTTLTRSVLKSTNADSAISLSGTAEVFITAAAEDLPGAEVVIVPSTALPAANLVDILNIPPHFSRLILHILLASCDTATRFLQLLYSTDNGSNFNTAGFWGTYTQNTTDVGAIDNISPITAPAQTAAQNTSFVIYLEHYNSIVLPLMVRAIGAYASGTPYSSMTGLIVVPAAAINALRIRWNSTGNFDAGTYALFGIR